jgi:O-antigen ligase
MSAYSQAMRATHAIVFLVALIGLHLLWQPRILWRREFTLYVCFVGYMFITLLWTRNLELASNTLVPAMCFILAMILFGSLINYHNVRTVLAGVLCGFGVAAAVYTLTSGFPLSYPVDFSYNTIASMYVFGLFVTLMYSSFRRSSGIVLLAITVVIMLHIVATTSIKTNIGIALGLGAAAVMYFGFVGQLVRRKALALIVLACGLSIVIVSNDALVDTVSRGGQRILIGVQVLQARDDVAGYSGFEDRGYWKQQGIAGWQSNPVFGYGVEAFRNDYGTTSHVTPVDLLYNYGIIGLVLFYSVFASLTWRLLQVTHRHQSKQRSLILGGVVCYVFVSLSGTMHYEIFLGAFIGISAALFAVLDRADLALGVSNQAVGHP